MKYFIVLGLLVCLLVCGLPLNTAAPTSTQPATPQADSASAVARPSRRTTCWHG